MATYLKANNTDNLNLTTSWSTSTVPTTADIGKWDSTVTGANATILGAAESWLGVIIGQPGGNVTINSDGNTLTVGSSGIDMTVNSNSRSFLLNCILAFGNSTNPITIGGNTLEADGGVTFNGGTNTITSTGSGVFKLNNASYSLGIGTSVATTITATSLTNFLCTVSAFNIAMGTGAVASTFSLGSGSTSTITATTMGIGATGSSVTATGTLRLGGTSTINCDAITIGQKRSTGTINFYTGLTAPAVTLRGTSGGTNAVTTMILGEYNTNGTGQTRSGTFNLGNYSDATVDGKITTLYAGSLNYNGSMTVVAAPTGSFIIGGTNSTVSVTTGYFGILRANYNPSGGACTGTGILTLNGGALTFGTLRLADMGSNGGNGYTGNVVVATASVAGGTLTVNTAFVMADQNWTGMASTNTYASLAITGGTVSANCNMVTCPSHDDTTTYPTKTVLQLAGGTLNMNGYNIGTAGAPIGGGTGSSMTWESGTLTAVGTINATAGLTKTTTGTLNLTGTNSFTGQVAVSAGTLNVTGTYNNYSTSNSTLIANSTTNAKMTISGTVTTYWLQLVTSAAVSGALYQTGGTLTVSGIASIGHFPLGYYAGSYGYYGLSSGAMTCVEMGVGSASDGDGLFELSGGSATFTTWFIIGHSGVGGSSQIGVCNVSGGTLVPPANFYSSWNTSATSVLNLLSGSGLINGVTNNVTMQFNTNGYVNLNGSTLQLQAVQNSGSGIFSFNGGTLKANTANANFYNNAGTALVYSGGAIIDDNNVNIGITQLLSAPTGSGISMSGVSLPTITGLISPPVVRVSGGSGTGGCAISTIDGSGNLTAVTVTCPGTGYISNPTFTLSGGGLASPNAFTASTVANTGGGLTKNGYATLTLSNASNSYTGPTTINAGFIGVTTLANGGSNSQIGASTSDAANLVFNGGNLYYTGATTSIDRLFTIGTGGGNIYAEGSINFTLSNTGTVAFSGSGSRSFGFNGSGSTFYIYPVLGDPSGGVLNVNSGEGGTRYSKADHTFTGILSMAGKWVVDKVTNGGVAGPNGAATSAASNWIFAFSNAEFQFNGSTDQSTDRLFSIASDTFMSGNYQKITSNGAGTLTFSNTGNITYVSDPVVSILPFRFDGPNTGWNYFYPALKDYNGTTRVLSVEKVGVGTWVLAGVNTYTGTTTVTTGILCVDGSTASGSAVSVASGAYLGGVGTVAGSVTLSAGAYLFAGSAYTGHLNTGALSFNATSTFTAFLNAATKTDGGVTSSGAISCAGTFSIGSLYGSPVIGDVYTVLSGTSRTGTFSGLPDGTVIVYSSRNLRINYTSTTVTLTDVAAGVSNIFGYTDSATTDIFWATSS